MGNDAPAYLQGRVRIFKYSHSGTSVIFQLLCLTILNNIWRPYAHSVRDCPLALCDGSTIRESDLIVCDNIQKTRLGETLLPLYNPDAKWYYLNGQDSDEVIVIKIFDSAADVAACCMLPTSTQLPGANCATGCPHTAFYHKEIPPDTRPRQSIEVRALVFTNSKSSTG